MKPPELESLLTRLIADWENEVVEFKNVGDSYSTSDIGKYFSALSNEANLRERECAWLVFGVDKRSALIEGRKPHFHVSASIARAGQTKASYIKTRALDDRFYRQLVTEYLEKFGSATRAELNDLLKNKLSDSLTETQKTTKIGNLLTKMRKGEVLVNVGARKTPRWQLARSKE